MKSDSLHSIFFSVITGVGLAVIILSGLTISLFIISDYDAVINKKLSDEIVLDGYGIDGLQSSNFVIHANNRTMNTALHFKNSDNGHLNDISINGNKDENVMFVSLESEIPFFNCWYKSIPCLFVAKWIPQFQLDFLKEEIKKNTPYCDEMNNCFDRPQEGMNLV